MLKRKSTIASVSIIVAVLLLSAVAVFAETAENGVDDTDKSAPYSKFIMNRMRNWRNNKENVDLEKVKEINKERFNLMLSNLVEQGIIDEDKADIILERYEEFISSFGPIINERNLIWDQLVEEGILTEEEVNGLKEALIEKRQEKPKVRIFDRENREEAFKEMLSQLVDEGVLTQDKADKVISFIEDKIAEKQELRENGGFWQQLVDDNIITEEELEIIQQNCSKNPMHKFDFRRGFRNRDE